SSDLEIVHGELFVEMLTRPGEQGRKTAGRRLQFQERGELRLPAAAAMIEHELARGLLRNLLAKILGNKRERQIDACGDAGRAPDIAVAHENPIGLQLHLRISGE